MTEVWPYRTSWIVLYIEETEDVDPKTLLKTVYQVSSWATIQYSPYFIFHNNEIFLANYSSDTDFNPARTFARI